MTFPKAPRAYSINEALSVIGCGRTHLYQELNAGRLKARKLGSRTVILEQDLYDYLDSLPHFQIDPRLAQ
ncbi:helix-turn-helix domain-containing protein [Pseudoxanthobacter sp. M-2]|uniref:helix-turn-helix domain-containing protein n=1 Tax=Pseudoxanthobacter sp. M-2 TaxID=3078754 RepID=UPI0038FC6E4A